MPVSVERAVSEPFFPNGVATSFPFDFKADSASEVIVVDVDGVALPSGLYSVTVNSSEGGMVVFYAPPAAADYPEIYIVSDPAMTQSSDFGNTGPSFNPAALTRAFDRAAIRDLALRAQIDRCIKVPFGESGITLPDNRGGLYLSFDAGGKPIASSGTGTDMALRSDLASGTFGALLLAWKSAGAGAVVRTLWARIADLPLNPKDFGAQGDGVTIDTLAINRTHRAANATGMAIHYTPGDYLVDGSDLQTVDGIGDVQTVPLADGVNLSMDGRAWLKRAPGTPDDHTAIGPIFITPLGNNIIQANIDGDEYPLSGGMGGAWRSDGGVGIYAVNASNVTLQNCRLRNLEYGVNAIGLTQWKIDNCLFVRIKLTGCLLTGNDATGCAHNKVTDSHFEEMGDTAVAFHYTTPTAVVSFNTVDNCTAKNTQMRVDGYAFDIEAAPTPLTHRHNSFRNLKVEQVEVSGFVQGGATMNANVTRSEILDCTLVGNGNASSPGISINGSDNIRVERNRIEGFGAGPLSRAGATNAIIEDNIGYRTRNGGTSAAIASGATIPHGLAVTPTSFRAAPTAAGATDVWVTADATHLTVNFGGGVTVPFTWEARA